MTMKEFMNGRFGVALSEPGTWRGIIMIVGALGYQLTDEQANHTVSTILELVGLIGLFFKDDVNSPSTFKKKTPEDLIAGTRE